MTAPTTTAAASAPDTPIHQQSVDELMTTLGMSEDAGGTPPPTASEGMSIELEEVDDPEQADDQPDDQPDDAPADDAPADEPEEEAPPADEPASATPAAPAPLTAKYVARNADGRQVQLPKGLTVEFTERGRNGEPDRIVKRPLDVVIRMAQQVVHLDRAYAQRNELREEIARIHNEQLPRVKEFVQDMLERQHEWFEDDTGEKFEAARQEYLKANTPEARLRRREHEDRERAAIEQAAKRERESVEFFRASIAPALAKMYEPFKDYVSQEELAGQIMLMSRPFAGPDRKIRPEFREEFLETLQAELPPWLEHRAAQRFAIPVPPRARKAPASAAATTGRATATERQVAKNRETRTLRPVARPAGAPTRAGASARPGQAPPKAPLTAKAANDAILEDLFAS